MNHEEFSKKLGEAAEGTAAKIGASQVFLSIFTDNFKESAVCLMQLGLAMVMGKPIILAAPEGTEISPNLRKIALKIIWFNPKENDKAEVMKQIMEALKGLENEKTKKHDG